MPATGGKIPRAQRFPIHLPILYRRRGDRDWHEGMTINFSRTGILFRAERKLPKNSHLELSIRFPEDLTVFCHGPVVRGETPQFPETQPALAIQIQHYNMVGQPGINNN